MNQHLLEHGLSMKLMKCFYGLATKHLELGIWVGRLASPFQHKYQNKEIVVAKHKCQRMTSGYYIEDDPYN